MKLVPALLLPILLAPLAAAQSTLPTAERPLARDLFKQLIEINTTHDTGSVTAAAQAMQARLLAAGFPAADMQIIGPTPTKKNLVVRYQGKPGLKPILIIAHLDVVEARRSDWTTDPFQFVEKDGYFYGRGTQDMKDSDAALVDAFIRLRREHFVPNRDLLLALTADEEGGESNGVDWLLKNDPALKQAAFVLNPDSGGPELDKGHARSMGVEATEKLYADFAVSTNNPGGHSSLPRKENAIYQLATALSHIAHAPFPLETNEITRAYFAASAPLQTGQVSADLKAVSAPTPDPVAAKRLSEDPIYNSLLHTTCVATMITGGHATNALPGAASANINCRILPGHSQEEVRLDLVRIVADPGVKVEYKDEGGTIVGHGSDRKSMAPPAPLPEVFKPLTAVTQAIWSGIPIVPEMETGASDSFYTMNAGIPSYGFSGMGVDRDDVRAHGRDERIRVEDFYTGVQFQYLYLKALTTP